MRRVERKEDEQDEEEEEKGEDKAQTVSVHGWIGPIGQSNGFIAYLIGSESWPQLFPFLSIPYDALINQLLLSYCTVCECVCTHSYSQSLSQSGLSTESIQYRTYIHIQSITPPFIHTHYIYATN
jgi:hypothetical protein